MVEDVLWIKDRDHHFMWYIPVGVTINFMTFKTISIQAIIHKKFWEYMVLKNTKKFCFGEVLRSSAWPHFFLNKEVRVMLLVLFCDLLDAFSAHIVNIIEQKKFTAWSTNTSHSQPLYRGITRPYCPAPTLPLRVWKVFLHCRRGSASPCEGVWSTRWHIQTGC